MNRTNNTIFFIHIPKTAGSSFRTSAEVYFGKQGSFYDYGPGYDGTHPKIVEYEYNKKDRFATGSYITKHARFFTGHIPYLKYAHFFSPVNVITFVRSPEQQVRSHFEHYVNLHGYQGSFKEFIVEKRFANIQSRMLNGIGIDGVGFVGLTEKYDTSLALINTLYKTNFKPLNINKNQQKDEAPYLLSTEELELIQKYNQEDIALYKKACTRFERQKKAIEESTPFIHFGLLPAHPKHDQQRINGWLTCYESLDAQEVAVYINGKQVETIIANEYRPIANERNINRSGYIGFHYIFPKDLKKNDLIELYAAINNELIYSTHYKEIEND